MPRLRLISLQCIKTEDTFGGDEPYLKLNGNPIWGPTTIQEDQTLSLNELDLIKFTQNATIQLLDQDTGFGDDDDLLGSLVVSTAQVTESADKEVTFTGDGAKYILSYRVLPDPPPPPPPPPAGLPDGKKPKFPIVKDASGARGYVRVTVDADGVVEMYMKVDCPAASDTTKYAATALICGYRDDQNNNVLQPRVEGHTLTCGSNPFHDSDKDETWFLPPIAPGDVDKIRFVRVSLVRDENHGTLVQQFVDACRQVGEAWDAADSLYKKVKNSELGQDAAVALASA